MNEGTKNAENIQKKAIGFTPSLTASELEKQAKPVIPASEQAKPLPFPLHVLPEKLQKIVQETKDKKQFPIDFTGTSIMFAVSVAMGNNFEYNAMNYKGKAQFWMGNVGSSGINKTSPLEFALEPIKKRDKQSFDDYKNAYSDYEANQRLSKDDQDDTIEQPKLQKHLLGDFTPETLAFIHQNNPKGLGVFADELKSWFGNFNRYNSGAVAENWLSMWSGQSFSIDRKTENLFFDMPFISVCGGIQPSILQNLAKNGNGENGFLHRILFAYPTDIIPEYPSLKDIDYNAYADYDQIINTLLDIPDLDEARSLQPTNGAKSLLFDYLCELTDLLRNAENEMQCGQISKLRIYLFRFALLFEGMFFACGESDMMTISERAVTASITTIEYFKNCGERVYQIIDNPESKLLKLPSNKQGIYQELNAQFKTSEAVKIGAKYGLKERAMKKFIKNTNLFTSVSHGQYCKAI